MHIHTYIYIYVHLSLPLYLSFSLSVSLFLSLSLYICTYAYLSLYIYIYIYWRSNLTKQKYPRCLQQHDVDSVPMFGVPPCLLVLVGGVHVLQSGLEVWHDVVLLVPCTCGRSPHGERSSKVFRARGGRMCSCRRSCCGVVRPRTRASTGSTS